MAIWIILSIVFLLAFTVSFVGIAVTPDGSLSGPLSLPAWAMYGEFDTEEVESWNRWVAPSLLWLYVMVSNVSVARLGPTTSGPAPPCAHP
jgi:hypothetical protein